MMKVGEEMGEAEWAKRANSDQKLKAGTFNTNILVNIHIEKYNLRRFGNKRERLYFETTKQYIDTAS